MTERAAPFYCPYCADEDLRPFGETHGRWRCGACQRVFGVKYHGIAADWATGPSGGSATGADAAAGTTAGPGLETETQP